MGTLSDYELDEAQYRLAHAEYQSKTIGLAAYCKRALATAQEMVAMMQARLESALVDVVATFPAKRLLFATQTQCDGVSGPRGTPR
jgi:hypothetical protein